LTTELIERCPPESTPQSLQHSLCNHLDP
jgi:hypothetical protein